MPDTAVTADSVIEVQHLATRFGSHVVHRDISFDVKRAEVLALIGGSGSGKSTLLREMILLHQPDAGLIRVLGVDLQKVQPAQATALRQRWGVVFQHGGLFASLTVRDNVALPLREHTGLSLQLINELAAWKLEMVGLPPEVGAQYPSELSGGMLKRASMARAMALDPELLFLDEPTAGLDPMTAAGVDALVLSLRDGFGLTVVMVTHDLDTLWQVADRVVVLADGQVAGLGTMQELARSDNGSVKAYFSGPRAHAAATASTPATAAAADTAAAAPAAVAAASPPGAAETPKEPPSKPK